MTGKRISDSAVSGEVSKSCDPLKSVPRGTSNYGFGLASATHAVPDTQIVRHVTGVTYWAFATEVPRSYTLMLEKSPLISDAF